MTHTLTHTTKRMDGNSGEDRTYLPQYTERKGSKIPENRQTERPDTLRNQQVVCSSHTTSSKKHRKLRLSVLFCCKNAENGVGQNGNVKKCAVGKYPKSEKHGNTAQFSEVERSGTQENCGGIGSGCRLRLRPLPVLRRRQSQRVARIDPNAVVVDKNIAENDRFDLFSR